MKPYQKYLKISLFLILLIISFGTPMILSSNSKYDNDQNDYTIQKSEIIDSIEIDGNGELASHPNVTGQGTWADPYVIEDFEILGPSSGSGITIENTNKPLIIRNCIIEDFDLGISFNNVSNTEINYNTASNNEYNGISLYNSNNNTLISNIIINNTYGIYLNGAQKNTLDNNTISDNNWGIMLYSSFNSTLFNNVMKSCGIKISGGIPSLLSNDINISNTVNGKPIYYYENKTGLANSNFTDAGQIILFKCTNSEISGLNTSDGSIGISLILSDNNTLTGNTALNNKENGIEILVSENNTLIDNIASYNNLNGIYLYGSHNNNLTGNTALYNEDNGIELLDALVNILEDNNGSYNEVCGIQLYSSIYTNLTSNTASFNEDSGIRIYESDHCTLIDNTLSYNKNNGIEVLYSDNIKLFNNLMSSCGIWFGDYGPPVSFSYEIDQSNTVNGKAIYFFKSQIGLEKSDYPDAGQIILLNCTNSKISEMTLSEGTVGISLYFSDNNSLTDNIILSNNHDGIYLYRSDNNTLTDNVVSNNNHDGIKLFQSDDNTFTDNTISNNKVIGIELYDSRFNTVYKNDLINNSANARDSSGIGNKWDDGSIGNYWDDYSGVDLNNDGIGDSPYDIPGFTNSQDRYPIIDNGPTIKIISPNINEEFGFDAPIFIVEITDPQLDTMWYLLNGGKDIIFITNDTFNQAEWDSLPEGLVEITFYANNTRGIVSSKSVIVIKDTSKSDISGYPFMMILSIMVIIMVILILFYRKKACYKL